MPVAFALFSASGCSMVAHEQNAAGVKLYQQGSAPQALQNFQKASTTDPRTPTPCTTRQPRITAWASWNNRKEDLAQAESLYNRSLDNDPNNKIAVASMAVLLVDQNRKREARLLQGWATRNPTSAGKGRDGPAIGRSRRQQSAKTHLTEALAIDPYNPRALAASAASTKSRAICSERWSIMSDNCNTIAFNQS